MRLNRHNHLAALTLLTCFLAGSTQSSDDISLPSSIGSAFRQYCVRCHGGEDNEADVDLVRLQENGLADNADLLSSVINVLDLREMPPEGEPSIPPSLRQQLIRELKSILHASVEKGKVYRHTPMRRMNRFQYNNAVVDLLDLRCVVFTLPERMMREHKNYFRPETGQMSELVTVGSRPLGKSQLIEKRLAGVAPFPQDPRAEHGFDNRGDHLSLSPLLMESFLKLSQSITRSPDFNVRNVGVWDDMFASPEEGVDEETEISARLQSLLRRAFRSPIRSDVLGRYTKFVRRQLDEGIGFTNAMKSAVAAVISSPRFLYLYDHPNQTRSIEPLDDFELASRLSFFLWGSIPDTELLDAADKHHLRQPEKLEAQVERMLRDRKLKRFCDSFPTQWLQLERIISSVPDEEKFPKFYFSKYRDSMHMMLEPLLLFETVLIEDRPITQLIDSDFTYRSATLEKAYGELGNPVPDGTRTDVPTAITFRRVPVSDRRTGGVITNAAVMTMTSGPQRTQPITRGAWIAGVIFNNPPEPPPADVPPLDEKPPEDEAHLTLRERLAMHRERADCKGCHEKIDPLGFALENYNAIGVWRDQYENGREVDASGTLFRKHPFSDIAEFKDAILSEKERFTRGLAAHLLSFALARELGPADEIAIDKIVSATASDQYRIQTLIKQVVLSEPFRSKTNRKFADSHHSLNR